MFEIILLTKQEEFIKTYDFPIIPSVNDHITLDEKTQFIVEERNLPATIKTNRVVLLGKLIKKL